MKLFASYTLLVPKVPMRPEAVRFYLRSLASMSNFACTHKHFPTLTLRGNIALRTTRTAVVAVSKQSLIFFEDFLLKKKISLYETGENLAYAKKLSLIKY